jgi:hypothetical protein
MKFTNIIFPNHHGPYHQHQHHRLYYRYPNAIHVYKIGLNWVVSQAKDSG